MFTLRPTALLNTTVIDQLVSVAEMTRRYREPTARVYVVIDCIYRVLAVATFHIAQCTYPVHDANKNYLAKNVFVTLMIDCRSVRGL